MRGITRAAPLDFLDWRIRANSVRPAQMSDTRITDRAPHGHPEANARVIAYGRLARPDEVAYAVPFLASDESSDIAGSRIVVDASYAWFALSRLPRRLQFGLASSARMPTARAPRSRNRAAQALERA